MCLKQTCGVCGVHDEVQQSKPASLDLYGNKIYEQVHSTGVVRYILHSHTIGRYSGCHALYIYSLHILLGRVTPFPRLYVMCNNKKYTTVNKMRNNNFTFRFILYTIKTCAYIRGRYLMLMITDCITRVPDCATVQRSNANAVRRLVIVLPVKHVIHGELTPSCLYTISTRVSYTCRTRIILNFCYVL